MRAYEFTADYPGDWALHCHKSHHTMNAMGHDLRAFIGVNKRDFAKQMRRLVGDYMPMRSVGMADMGEMEMPLPDNTIPMMTGFGQFGPVEMGGMFTVLKVREGLAAGDYKDPGWYKRPPGTVAYGWEGPTPVNATAPGGKPVLQGRDPVNVVKSGSKPSNDGSH
ncbi:MAG: multicopper oxidase domain-containing protein [Reyranella sp.]|nr:multicopper oxidase domain-containing protein [Reyranella sp.]